jgi:hypothetical protein
VIVPVRRSNARAPQIPRNSRPAAFLFIGVCASSVPDRPRCSTWYRSKAAARQVLAPSGQAGRGSPSSVWSDDPGARPARAIPPAGRCGTMIAYPAGFGGKGDPHGPARFQRACDRRARQGRQIPLDVAGP